MSEWIAIERWAECRQLERPGIIFEVSNGRQSLFTACTVPLQIPADWTSQPLRFRMVAESLPRHSTPIPAPQRR